MRTVHKYPVKLVDHFNVRMLKGAEVLHVNVQHGEPVMWARVDTKAPMVDRAFRLAGTGHDLGGDAEAPYLGTVILSNGALVFHLFDLGEEP